jgi:hypothetical protein
MMLVCLSVDNGGMRPISWIHELHEHRRKEKMVLLWLRMLPAVAAEN